eukprot:5861597-Amphidinium_carterae.1
MGGIAQDRIEKLMKAGVDEGAKLLVDGRNPSVPEVPATRLVGIGWRPRFSPVTWREGIAALLGWGWNQNCAGVKKGMSIYENELFGPVLCCVEVRAAKVDTYDEAIAFVNSNAYGNGTAVFTRTACALTGCRKRTCRFHCKRSGAAARKYVNEIEAGQRRQALRLMVTSARGVPHKCFCGAFDNIMIMRWDWVATCSLQVGVNVPIPVPLPMFSFTGNKKSIL